MSQQVIRGIFRSDSSVRLQAVSLLGFALLALVPGAMLQIAPTQAPPSSPAVAAAPSTPKAPAAAPTQSMSPATTPSLAPAPSQGLTDVQVLNHFGPFRDVFTWTS